MPFHFCPDELAAIMMSIPVLGGCIHWLRHKLRRTTCHKNQDCIPKCEHPIQEEVYDPLDP